MPLWGSWAVLGVLLAATLLIGSGVLNSSPTTNAQRAAALDARLKSPDSGGLSVVESNSAAAAAVRHQVRTQVDQGKSDDEIVVSLEARYGNAVLLTPPAGGLSVLLWVVPAALALGIAVAIVVVFRRRRLDTGAPGV